MSNVSCKRSFWFGIALIFIAIFFLIGFYCLISIEQDVKYFPYFGTIVDVECSSCAPVRCYQTIFIVIGYINDNITYYGIYETDSFPNCEPTPSISGPVSCCSNLINNNVYFSTDIDDSYLINDVSYNRTYNKHYYLISAVVYLTISFFLIFITFCIMINCCKFTCLYHIKNVKIRENIKISVYPEKDKLIN